MKTGSMKTRPHQPAPGFTLLEMVIVLAIVALVLGAVYSIAHGTLTLADDALRAQRRDGRAQALTAFCERLMMELPATAALNLKTTEEGGQYLTALELDNVPSPFDGAPDCNVGLFTESMPGGGLRLMLSVRREPDPDTEIRVVLLEGLTECGWRVFDNATRQWTTLWREDTGNRAPHIHPALLEWSATLGADRQRRVFWIAPNEPVSTNLADRRDGTPPLRTRRRG